jgi:hypothetical protein
LVARFQNSASYPIDWFEKEFFLEYASNSYLIFIDSKCSYSLHQSLSPCSLLFRSGSLGQAVFNGFHCGALRVAAEPLSFFSPHTS